MSFSILYKRLVEVQFLHEYFLLQRDAEPYFGLPEAQQREILFQKISRGQYDFQNQLEWKPSPETESLMKQHEILIAHTVLGFFLGIEVDESRQGAVGNQFFPVRSIEEPLKLSFLLRNRDPLWANFTQTRLRQRIPAIYFFSNREEPFLEANTSKTFPKLSLPASLATKFPAPEVFQGEMAVFMGALREAQVHFPIENGDWMTKNTPGVVIQRDRRLLGPIFTYRSFAGDQILQLDIFLTDKEGREVARFSHTQERPISQVEVKLGTEVPPNPPDEIARFDPVADGEYLLTVEGKAESGEEMPITLSYQKEVIIDSSLYDPTLFGVVNLEVNVGESDFHLLTPEGSLRRFDESGKSVHPKFQICFRSRSTYWRYRQEKDFPQDLVSKTQDYLAIENAQANRLLTRSPHLLAQDPRKLSYTQSSTGNLDEKIVPLPAPRPLKWESDRVVSEIYISPVNPLNPR